MGSMNAEIRLVDQVSNSLAPEHTMAQQQQHSIAVS